MKRGRTYRRKVVKEINSKFVNSEIGESLCVKTKKNQRATVVLNSQPETPPFNINNFNVLAENENFCVNNSDEKFTEIDNNLNFSNASSSNSSYNLTDDLRHIAVDSTVCGTTMNKILVVLNKYLPWLPSDVRTLRKTPRKADICNFAPDCNFFYIGIARALHYFFEKAPIGINKIEIDIGIDGLPISKSSKSQLWPILLNIVGFPDIFVVAAYHGKTKAINFQEFLKDFIEEMTIIEDIGFEYENRSIVVKLRCLICDSDARAKVLSVKSHSGYFSCTKCTIKGESIGPGHIVFPFAQNALAMSRTNITFKNRADPQHHKCMTPIALENIRFGGVSQVPIDYMHCVLLGTMKQLLNLWIKKRKFEYSLSKPKLLKISNLLTSIKLPIEFNRQPRSLEEYERWKATEFRHFLLYTGPVILKNILQPMYYEHFLKIFCGICILSHKTFCKEQNFTAKYLLEQFSGNMEKLYGPNSATFNVHKLKLKIKSGHLPLNIIGR